MNKAYEEYYKRLHRIVGHYLAIQAWLRGLDCIVLVHSDFKAFLGLQTIQKIQIEKFMVDVEPWFPFQKWYSRKNAKTSTSSLFLSRVSIAQHLPSGRMSVDERIAQMKPSEDGVLPPNTKRFSKGASTHEIPSHIEIVSYLAVLADGLKAPQTKIRNAVSTKRSTDVKILKFGVKK